MNQELDEVRTLAIKLFEAGEAEKRKQPKHIWGETRTWRDLPSESVAVWDAIALCAFDETVRLQTAKLMALKKTTPRHRPPTKIHVHASQGCGAAVSTPLHGPNAPDQR